MRKRASEILYSVMWELIDGFPHFLFDYLLILLYNIYNGEYIFLYIKGNTFYYIYYIINNIINQLIGYELYQLWSKPALSYFALDGMRLAACLGDVANATYPNSITKMREARSYILMCSLLGFQRIPAYIKSCTRNLHIGPRSALRVFSDHMRKPR